MAHTVLRAINPRKPALLTCVLLKCVLLSACGVGHSSPVPLGTWKDVEANRYITISILSPDETATAHASNSAARSFNTQGSDANGDPQTTNAKTQKPWDKPEFQKQYTALLFSVHEVEATGASPASLPASSSTPTPTPTLGESLAEPLAESLAEPLAEQLRNKLVIKERTLPAVMKEGVLTLKAGATEISVLYHPSGELIMVNGISEFRRVPEEQAKITLAKLQNP